MVKPIIDMQGMTVTVPSKRGMMVPILNGGEFNDHAPSSIRSSR